jgi:predicted TIM-barrel fold metal-dependent hydrolase
MIDTHIHVVPPRLPGVGALNPLLEADHETLAAALRTEMQTADITHAFAMGCWSAPEDDPLGVADTLALARLVPGLHAIGIADPARTDSAHLHRVETALASKQVVALKAYLGYLPYAPDDPAYRPYYELAERHGLPFIFHTGDTYSPRARLRYARPLLIDDLAVDHPRVKFVLAHLGNPWLTDAAEVVYKNMNVWADLSGLVVGTAEDFGDSASEERRETLHEAAAELRRAFRYAERPNRFLYGSDWPLVPMAAYRSFIAGALAEVYHPLVFEENARLLFRV